MRKLLFKIASVALLQTAACTQAMAENWLTPMPDDIYISRISMPGTHDAGTGNGFNTFLGSLFGQTQDLSISQQWDCGVRAFDLRPTVKKSGSNYTLQIYHGALETKVSFKDALLTLRDKLQENPGEFAVVIMRHESDANSSVQGEWPSVMETCLNSEELKDCFIKFKPKMTLGDVRGKILLLSRNEYNNGPVGGYITGWGHSENIADQRSGRITGNGNESLMVQDFYECTGTDGMTKKTTAIANMFKSSMVLSKRNLKWVINHASGYTQGASTSGILDNAAKTSQFILEYLSEPANNGFIGIVMMDFAGVNTSSGYKVNGLDLVNAVIAQNARYDQVSSGIEFKETNANSIRIIGREVLAEGQIHVYLPDGTFIGTSEDKFVLPSKGLYVIKSNETVRKVLID